MSDEAMTQLDSMRWTRRLRLQWKARFGRRYTVSIAGNVRQFGDSIRLLPRVLWKPRLLRLWLLSARRAQLASAVTVLVLSVIVPPVSGVIADAIYPPVTTEKRVLIVLKRDQTRLHPSRHGLYTKLIAGSWALGLGFVAMLFVNHLPAAVRLGQRRARVLLADAATRKDRSESAVLHTLAQALVTDSVVPGESLEAGSAPQSQQMAKTMRISGARPERKRYLGADDRYRLDKVIGSGGMGVVHAGYDTVLQRRVALKQLFAHLVEDPEHNQRFRQEATALAAANHNHIVGIYDLLEESGSFWIVMELLTGGSLGDKMVEGTAMAVDDSVDVTCKIADGLGYAHSLGMVHRDVKPMNILFTSNGTPKLADFGNAKTAMPSIHTQHGVTLGSPMYMSPEQAAGEAADHRSDIYSLGVSLYHMLTGKVPFDGDVGAILAQHIGQAPQPPNELNGEIPADLADTVLVMLNKKPEERFQNTLELITALRHSFEIAAAG